MPPSSIPPHGGVLTDLMADPQRSEELRARSRDWPSWDLTERQLCDLELLLNGGFSPELGVTMVPFRQMVYVEDQDAYYPENEVPKNARVLNISGTELRARLSGGREIPDWFTYAEVANELRRTHPPRHHQGFTLFFTGLPSSGKATIANVLLVKLLEIGGRPLTLLDGDIVRKHFCSELGFSKEHVAPCYTVHRLRRRTTRTARLLFFRVSCTCPTTFW